MLSRSVMSNSLQPHRLQPSRLLCPWDSPGKNTRVSSHALLQGISPTPGLSPGLLHCRQILCHLSHRGRYLLQLGYISEAGSHALLQGISPTPELSPGLLHCRQILCHLSHRGRQDTSYSLVIFPLSVVLTYIKLDFWIRYIFCGFSLSVVYNFQIITLIMLVQINGKPTPVTSALKGNPGFQTQPQLINFFLAFPPKFDLSSPIHLEDVQSTLPPLLSSPAGWPLLS